MPTFAVTSVGHDRPGIVAAVTGVLAERGCNLEDTAMSILRGQFAMVMIVGAPEPTSAADLESDLSAAATTLGLSVTVREVDPLAGAADAFTPRCTVVVYGPDHPGIVHLVSRELAARGVNIVDVVTRVSGTGGGLYSMVLEAALPPGLDVATLERDLAAVGGDDGLTVRVSPADADLL